MLHEQSHLLGSRKETTGENHQIQSHGDCVMSYNRNNDTLVNYFNNSNDYEKLYCDNCKQAIKRLHRSQPVRRHCYEIQKNYFRGSCFCLAVLKLGAFGLGFTRR